VGEKTGKGEDCVSTSVFLTK